MELLIFSFKFFLLAGGEKGGLLDVNPGLIFWTVVTFILLLLILKRTAWKPMLEALKQREDSIRTALEKSEQAKLEAEKLLEENKKNLAAAEEQAKKIIDEGREFSSKLKAEILDKANEDAKKLLDQTKIEIDRKKDEALNELREVVADLAIQATEKLIDEKLDDKKHRSLIDKFISTLPRQ
ncbi:MAG: F0F1 ATP synthase subunit B [Ignavibacteria bacterium]|nr:F0F1 ATP synthase subunit B [Ignavibacteria bacterium]